MSNCLHKKYTAARNTLFSKICVEKILCKKYMTNTTMSSNKNKQTIIFEQQTNKQSLYKSDDILNYSTTSYHSVVTVKLLLLYILSPLVLSRILGYNFILWRRCYPKLSPGTLKVLGPK